MVAAALIGILLAAPSDAPCTPRAVLDSRGALTDELRTALRRAGVVALSRAPAGTHACAVHVQLEGTAPPYTLRIHQGESGARALQVHSVDLASAMVESALGGLAPPPRGPPPLHWQPALALRANVSADGLGAVYVGPEVSLTACLGSACADVHGRFGQGVSTEARGAIRREVSAVAGGSLEHRGEGYGLRAGLAAGVRWTELTTPPSQPSAIEWPEPRWPYDSLVEARAFFAWEGNLSAFVTVAEGWTLDGQLAVQHVPDADSRSRTWIDYTGDVVVRLGLGVRWGVSR